jgi:Tfp pilus assembly protein PilV
MKRYKAARETGFTMVEVVGSIFFLSVGLLALAGALITTSHGREQSVSRSLVMAGAQALLEEIKCTPNPRDIAIKYDGAKFKVKNVNGYHSGNAISVSVDSTNPNLVTVTVSGAWTTKGHQETLELRSQIYSYSGQKS